MSLYVELNSDNVSLIERYTASMWRIHHQNTIWQCDRKFENYFIKMFFYNEKITEHQSQITQQLLISCLILKCVEFLLMMKKKFMTL